MAYDKNKDQTLKTWDHGNFKVKISQYNNGQKKVSFWQSWQKQLRPVNRLNYEQLIFLAEHLSEIYLELRDN